MYDDSKLLSETPTAAVPPQLPQEPIAWVVQYLVFLFGPTLVAYVGNTHNRNDATAWYLGTSVPNANQERRLRFMADTFWAVAREDGPHMARMFLMGPDEHTAQGRIAHIRDDDFDAVRRDMARALDL